MNRLWLVGSICIALISAAPAHAGFGIAAKVSTLGIGVEATAAFAPRVNGRVGVNFFKYSFSGAEGDVEYDTDLKLRSFSLLLDLHPIPVRGLRLSGGLLFNRNKLEMESQPTSTYTIGDRTYTGAEGGALFGDVGFKSTAPYVGIGWGNAAKSRIGIVFDLGVAFQGSPDVALTATGPIASDATFREELNQEVREVEDDIKNFKYYPVVSLGISFRLSAF